LHQLPVVLAAERRTIWPLACSYCRSLSLQLVADVEITLAEERSRSCSSWPFTIADDVDRTRLCLGTPGAATRSRTMQVPSVWSCRSKCGGVLTPPAC